MRQPNVLFRGGLVLDLDTGSQTPMDIRVESGVITDLGANLTPRGVTEHVIDLAGALVSVGWMDMHVHLREPGYEHKETIATGCDAAAQGGFTDIACMPNTDPPASTRDVVAFIRAQNQGMAVRVHPIGCVSAERKGQKLAEMADLAEAGAVAFSDDGSPVQDGGLMRLALEYAKMLGRPIINHMEDLTLNRHGDMHEGRVSTRLGLAGIPVAAEDVMVARDIQLAELTGGHVHVAHISSKESVNMVRDAKKKGLKVTAEVCTHHLVLTDEEVERRAYDANTKMHPPLRSQKHVEALHAGLADGTIDVLCTDHAPHATYEKDVEFSAAPFGILGLESAWGLIGRHVVATGTIPLAEAIRKMTIAPRAVLGLPQPSIAVGAEACLTVFDTQTSWTFEARHVRSKSRNTPFYGHAMLGQVHGIYNDGQWVPATR